jgi:hypothetical protein
LLSSPTATHFCGDAQWTELKGPAKALAVSRPDTRWIGAACAATASTEETNRTASKSANHHSHHLHTRRLTSTLWNGRESEAVLSPACRTGPIPRHAPCTRRRRHVDREGKRRSGRQGARTRSAGGPVSYVGERGQAKRGGNAGSDFRSRPRLLAPNLRLGTSSDWRERMNRLVDHSGLSPTGRLASGV